ncbi:hypothetical protein JHK84_033947 [Glycine max]|uniref:Putative enoyl-CoA hydratase 1, peroxisomal n=1 Tax=Glycine soja TaxID=3848 RepID=A0A445HPS2_GLYSO|nr:hypothetical protein JHK84_033947 [Glycine max]RZB75600.1 putative enoyl-CoA hydratase 1, peroxisomal [Glycine soja]
MTSEDCRNKHFAWLYRRTASDFTLEVLSKNCCLVEGVLHLPENPSVYFLLPIPSILAGPVGLRHYPNHTTPGPVVPHYNNYHLGPDLVKKEPQREYYEKEFDDEDGVDGRKIQRNGYHGYGYARGKSSLSAPMRATKARELSLLATPLTAEAAERLCFANHIVEEAQLLKKSREVADAIVKINQDLVLRYKAVINDGLKLDLGRTLSLEKVSVV